MQSALPVFAAAGWGGRPGSDGAGEAGKKPEGRECGVLGTQNLTISRGCALGRVVNFKPQTHSYFLGAPQALAGGLVTLPEPPDIPKWEPRAF